MVRRLRALLVALLTALMLVLPVSAVQASEAPGVRPPTTDGGAKIQASNCIVTFEYRGNMYFVKRYVGYSLVNEYNTYSYTLARAKYDEWVRLYKCNNIES